MPLLPADFIHARGCKPICAKLLTLPFNPDLFECVSVSVYDIEKLQYTSKKVL